MPAATLAALADDTRMGIVEALAARDHTVNELVGMFPISQPAISRHLRVLREAGVVESEAHGKLRIYRLNPSALRDVSDWTEQCRRTWEARFDKLGQHLDRMSQGAEKRRGRASADSSEATDNPIDKRPNPDRFVFHRPVKEQRRGH